MKEFIKKNRFNIIVMIIYSVTTIIAVLFHENWRDEAQAWLIARDLNVIDIFRQMRYEGHPCLWHLILLPFAKLGFPYITENIISWIIMNVTAILILKKCPLDKFLKILILFSAPFIYSYPAISRSYCLIPLAIVLIAITYRTRKEKPIRYVLAINLLAHTHVLMLGLVGMLYLFFFFEEIVLNFKNKTNKEKKKIILSLVIAILGLFLLVVQLSGSTNTNTDIDKNFTLDKEKVELFVNVFTTFFAKIVGSESFGLVCLIIGISSNIFIYQMIVDKNTTIIVSVALMFQFFIYSFIYSSVAYQKIFTGLIIIIFFTWVQKYDYTNKKKLPLLEIYLSIILMFNCVLGVRLLVTEIKYQYSYSREAAEFVKNNIPEESTFIASDIPCVSAIIPYTHEKYKFWSPQTNDYFTFATWNEKTTNLTYNISDIIKKINTQFDNKDNLYLIYSYNWAEEDLNSFIDITSAKILYTSDESSIQYDEKYIIYKLYTD